MSPKLCLCCFHQAHRHRPHCGIVGLGVKQSLEARLRPHRIARNPIMLHSRWARCIRLAYSQLQALRQRRARPARHIQFDLGQRVALLNHQPMRRPHPTLLVQRPVAYQFPIQAAVVGIVDLLRHQSIEQRAHLRDRFLHLDFQHSRRLLASKPAALAAQQRAAESRTGGSEGSAHFVWSSEGKRFQPAILPHLPHPASSCNFSHLHTPAPSLVVSWRGQKIVSPSPIGQPSLPPAPQPKFT